MTDLIKLAKSGNQHAQDALYKQFEPLLVKLSHLSDFSLLGEEAMEIASIAFTVALTTCTEPEAFPGYLRQIVLCDLYDAVKKRCRTVSREVLSLDDDENMPNLVATDEDKQSSISLKADLTNAIATLSSKQQAVIKGIFVQDKTARQLAKEFHTSPPAIAKIKMRALKNLKRTLNRGSRVEG